MAKQPVPLIRQEHYQAFVAIPTLNIPDSFDGWRNARADERAQLLKSGIIAVDIEVDPDKFTRFCHGRGLTASFDAIKDFVVEEFRRQEDANDKARRTATGRDPKEVMQIPEC